MVVKKLEENFSAAQCHLINRKTMLFCIYEKLWKKAIAFSVRFLIE